MVMVMGLIREVEVTSTKVTYTIDDTTASIKAIKWVESEVVSVYVCVIMFSLVYFAESCPTYQHCISQLLHKVM